MADLQPPAGAGCPDRVLQRLLQLGYPLPAVLEAWDLTAHITHVETHFQHALAVLTDPSAPIGAEPEPDPAKASPAVAGSGGGDPPRHMTNVVTAPVVGERRSITEWTCAFYSHPGGPTLGSAAVRDETPLYEVVQIAAAFADATPLQTLLWVHGVAVLEGQYVSDVMGRRDVRVGVSVCPPAKGYVLWVTPRSTVSGIWLGGTRAWGPLSEHLPGRQYSYRDGTRLCSIEPGEDPWEIYQTGREQHGAPAVPWFRWVLRPARKHADRW